jgi:hypothetical protein
MDHTLIYKKLSTLPESMKSEVIDFIEFLLSKQKKVAPSEKKPKFGSGKGMFKMKSNFESPIEDFNDYQ